MAFSHMLALLPLAVLTLLAALPTSSAYSGHLTFYGWNGATKESACTSSYNYPGFTTVAMNQAQYKQGFACGGCIQACYVANGNKRCFKAVVNNACPGCPYGNLDLGEAGDGFWPVQWSYIKCPPAKLVFRTESGNPWYGKLKIEGGGRVLAVTCKGRKWTRTVDGYFEGSPAPGGSTLNCGIKCSIRFDYGRVVVRRIPGSLFGPRGVGSC